MTPNTLTLRQILNTLSSQVDESFTEEQLLDLPIKVHVSHASGVYTTTAPVRDCSIKTKQQYNSNEGRLVTTEKWIDMNADYILQMYYNITPKVCEGWSAA